MTDRNWRRDKFPVDLTKTYSTVPGGYQQGTTANLSYGQVTISADHDNYDPVGNNQNSSLILTTTQAVTITGWVANREGETKYLFNNGNFTITFANADAGSLAKNRFDFGTDILLASKSGIEMWYDMINERWKIKSSSMGGGGGAVTDGGIEFTFDGNGSELSAGAALELVIPFACTLTEVSVVGDQTGSVEFEIEKCNFVDYDGGLASIVAASPPEITSGLTYRDSTLSGWTVDVAIYNVLRCTISSVSDFTRLTLGLRVIKSGGGGGGEGTVTEVDTGTGLTGGPITDTGTIAIDDTGVDADTYGDSTHIPQLTVNAQGQVTDATEIALGGVTSIIAGNGIAVNQATGAVTVSVSDVPFINMANHVTLNGNGTTDNATAFDTWHTLGQTFNLSFPRTFTVTIASPAVFTLSNHGFRVNEAIQFTTTGALPTGLTVGTTYYVLSSALTASTFKVSTTNPWPGYGGEGTAVNTSGSQSGTHSVRMIGAEWQKVLLPPGNYHTSVYSYANGNQRKLDFSGYGATSDNLNFTSIGLATDWSFNRNVFAPLTASAVAGDSSFFVSTSYVTRFQIGGWVCLMALDIQSDFNVFLSYPPNNHYAEFCKITAINAGTGEITVRNHLRNSYSINYPTWYAGSVTPLSGSVTDLQSGGAAVAMAMNSNWDCEKIIRGLHDIRIDATVSNGRELYLIDCLFDTIGPQPTQNRVFSALRCKWGQGTWSGGVIENDKLAEQTTYEDCEAHEMITPSSTAGYLKIVRGYYDHVWGTSRNCELNEATIDDLEIGVEYGATEKFIAVDCIISRITPKPMESDALSTAPFYNCLSNFTFSNGNLTQAIATSHANRWAVPGRGCVINDMAGNYRMMGSPFTVLGITVSGGTLSIGTTLSAMPVGNSTSSTVTITIASPGVVTWNSHGLSNGTPVILQTSGALPTGLNTTTLYYIISAAANTFQLSTTVGGSAVNTSGSQSGTHTAIANPLHIQPIPCLDTTFIGCTGSLDAQQLSLAPPGRPLYEYMKMRFVGGLGTSANFTRKPQVYGNLVRMTVNVIRAFSAGGGLTRTFSASGFNSSLIASNFSQVIDLTQTGVRIITPNAVTGNVGSDVLVAYGDWIANPLSIVDSLAQAGNLLQNAVVEVEIITDQGFNRPATIEYANFGDPNLIVDTTTPVPF